MITMNDLHLSSDDRSSFQSHLDEFAKRLTSVIILVVILTIVWSFSIDEIHRQVLQQLDPCSDSCINIFSPDEWAGTRWLSASLLGLFTAAPFAMIQAYTFARPGLLPSERRAFVIWMTIMWALALCSLVFTVTEFLPWLYAYGHSFNDDTGIVGRYDAAEMLMISISIAWAIILVLAAMSVVVIAGMSKLLWSGNAGWWRLRIHGFMLMLLWLVIPDGLPGLLFTLTFIASGLVETAGYRAFRAPIPIGHGLMDLLDIEGRTYRVMYVDCSCNGTTPRIAPLRGMGYVSYESVCRSSEQQDMLLDAVKRFGADKLVFSGCVIESLPVEYIDSLRFLGCDTQSLDLAHLSAIRTDGNSIDSELAMASIEIPWSEHSVNQRCTEILSESQFESIYYGDRIPFGLNLQPNEAWITNPSPSLIERIEDLGIETNLLSN
jgi:Sec-independent protein secretion pathway component TatC